jgi:hypothetical protein
MAYTHTPATFTAAALAAIRHDLNNLNNTQDKQVIEDMLVAFIAALSAEFEVIDQT